MQALLRRDAREVSHGEAIGVKLQRCVVSFQIDAQRHYVHFALGDAEVAAHVAGIILADRSEAVHVLDVGADQIERLCAVGFRELAEEQVFALEGAADGAADGFADGLGEADQQRIRQRHDVGRRLAAQPGRQFMDLFALAPVFAAQHGDGHFAQQVGIHRNRAARGELQGPLGIPEAVEQPRRVAEKAGVLFEIDADASEEDLVRGHVGLVG